MLHPPGLFGLALRRITVLWLSDCVWINWLFFKYFKAQF